MDQEQKKVLNERLPKFNVFSGQAPADGSCTSGKPEQAVKSYKMRSMVRANAYRNLTTLDDHGLNSDDSESSKNANNDATSLGIHAKDCLEQIAIPKRSKELDSTPVEGNTTNNYEPKVALALANDERDPPDELSGHRAGLNHVGQSRGFSFWWWVAMLVALLAIIYWVIH